MGLKLHQAGVTYAKGRISNGKVNYDDEWSFSDEEKGALLSDGSVEDFGKWHLTEDTTEASKSAKRYLHPYGKNGLVYQSALTATIAACKKEKSKGRTKLGDDFEALGEIIEAAQEILEIVTGKNANSRRVIPLGDPSSPVGVILSDPAYPILLGDNPEMIEGGGIKAKVQICRTGKFLGHPQYPFEMDDDFLAAIKVNFDRFKNELAFDYGHDSVWNMGFLASGWGRALSLERSGNSMMCDVAWTQRAAEFIRAGEYKYISPVIIHHTTDPFTAEDIGPSIWTVALVNSPFLPDMDPVQAGKLLNSARKKRDDAPPHRVWAVPESVVLALAGHPINTSPPAPAGNVPSVPASAPAPEPPPAPVPEDSTTASSEEDEMPTIPKSVLAKYNLPEDATEDDLNKAIDEEKQALSTLRSEHEELKKDSEKALALAEEFKNREQAKREKEAKDMVERYIAAGRITPASRERAEKMALADLDSFHEVYGKPDEPGQAVVPMGDVASPEAQDQAASSQAPTLEEGELAVCSKLGISPERYAEIKASKEAKGRKLGKKVKVAFANESGA